MNVVFTGPAYDSSGNSILRSNLAYACTEKGGIHVQLKVNSMTDALVASRTDTVKAKGAAMRGITVWSYPEFIAMHLRGVNIPSTGKANGYVDKVVDPDLLVPVFVESAQLELMDVL